MKKFISTAAFVIAWMVPIFWEILILFENPWQILNPLLQYKVLWWTITTPIFWLFLGIGILFLVWGSRSKKVDHNI